jgi:hypothetical protein
MPLDTHATANAKPKYKKNQQHHRTAGFEQHQRSTHINQRSSDWH